MTVRITLAGTKRMLDSTARWRAADAKSRREEMDREDALSVALWQPHRRGNDDPRLESALGRFCVAEGIPTQLYAAGVIYRDVVLEARQAMGLGNPGWSAGTSGYTDGQTDKQIADRVAKTRARQDEADAILRRIKFILPSRMRSMCVLELEVNQEDRTILRAGLVALHALFGVGRNKVVDKHP